jgi:8-oxo-dGTP pyrophosphatase MutT (NUDIX family)
MGRRKNNSGAGLLSTPGGRLEKDETILQCARREFKEETGAELAGDLKVIGWHEHFRFGNHYIMFYVHAREAVGIIHNVEPEKCEGWMSVHIENINLEDTTEPQDILNLLIN